MPSVSSRSDRHPGNDPLQHIDIVLRPLVDNRLAQLFDRRLELLARSRLVCVIPGRIEYRIKCFPQRVGSGLKRRADNRIVFGVGQRLAHCLGGGLAFFGGVLEGRRDVIVQVPDLARRA